MDKDIVIIVLSAVVIALQVVIIFRLFTKGGNGAGNKSGDVSLLGDCELKKIREAVSESTTALSLSISTSIADKNSYFVNRVVELTDEILKAQTSLSQRQEEFIKEFFVASGAQKDDLLNKFSQQMKEFNNAVEKTILSFDASIKEKLGDFKDRTAESIKILSDGVAKNLAEIREDNNTKLEQINSSVNEKLQKTLEEKLKNSFESVVQGIGDVNKAVGEIKGIASDVGSLKNVLTNVKTKGIMGEVILGNIIREFLTPAQFDENIATKKNSQDRVEFAIKLPGVKDDVIYLPVDSKFPYQPYSVINESADGDKIQEARLELRRNLLTYAKDVSEKYIDVPNTTDFAIIFLPLEGLYLEALNMGLFEEIQQKYKVNLTGPTTFTAFVNSLNMGFRSLMIQKKSADVFKLLGAVKTEFAKFATSLESTQKSMNKAVDELDKLVGTRTRLINSKLSKIDALDDNSASFLLNE